jgi:hypothetical protein
MVSSSDGHHDVSCLWLLWCIVAMGGWCHSACRYHYVRNTQARCARTKNRDTQMACLRHHVLHYRVIRDVRPSMSLISIHWICALLERVSNYGTHPRRASKVRVTNLIASWGPYGTNMRCARGRASLITNESETLFILARHRFNCHLEALWH